MERDIQRGSSSDFSLRGKRDVSDPRLDPGSNGSRFNGVVLYLFSIFKLRLQKTPTVIHLKRLCSRRLIALLLLERKGDLPPCFIG